MSHKIIKKESNKYFSRSAYGINRKHESLQLSLG